MIEWYVEHVYVLPAQFYVFIAIGPVCAFLMRCFELATNRRLSFPGGPKPGPTTTEPDHPVVDKGDFTLPPEPPPNREGGHPVCEHDMLITRQVAERQPAVKQPRRAKYCPRCGEDIRGLRLYFTLPVQH